MFSGPTFNSSTSDKALEGVCLDHAVRIKPDRLGLFAGSDIFDAFAENAPQTNYASI